MLRVQSIKSTQNVSCPCPVSLHQQVEGWAEGRGHQGVTPPIKLSAGPKGQNQRQLPLPQAPCATPRFCSGSSRRQFLLGFWRSKKLSNSHFCQKVAEWEGETVISSENDWDACRGRPRYPIIFLSLISTLSHLGAFRPRQNDMREFAQSVTSALCQIIGKPQVAGLASAPTWNLVGKQVRKAPQWSTCPAGSKSWSFQAVCAWGSGPGPGMLRGQLKQERYCCDVFVWPGITWLPQRPCLGP